MSVEVQDASSWYVIRTGPKQEQRAISNLNALLVEGLLPKVRFPRLNPFTRITTYMPGPMFPRYAFARFNASRLLHRVRNTRGVRGVVSFGGVPAPVEDSIIELMKNQTGDDGFVQIGAELKMGDHVKVKSGPLANFVGVFDHKVDSSDRVAILLTAVGYQGRLVIEKGFVEKVKCNRTLSHYNAS